MPEESVVVSEGLTVSGSQMLASGPWLFLSPLYTAFQLYCPAVVGVCVLEGGTFPFVTVTVKMETGDPEQLPEEKNLYVILPPALLVKPIKVAVSCIDCPDV